MGVDGHVAALYPHHEALGDTSAWVLQIKSPSNRITLALHVINNSKKKFVVLAGDAKAVMVEMIIRGKTTDKRPASLLKGDVHWFLDKSAASKL